MAMAVMFSGADMVICVVAGFRNKYLLAHTPHSPLFFKEGMTVASNGPG